MPLNMYKNKMFGKNMTFNYLFIKLAELLRPQSAHHIEF